MPLPNGDHHILEQGETLSKTEAQSPKNLGQTDLARFMSEAEKVPIPGELGRVANHPIVALLHKMRSDKVRKVKFSHSKQKMSNIG